MNENTSSTLKKIGIAIAGLAALIGAALFLNQGKLSKKAAPVASEWIKALYNLGKDFIPATWENIRNWIDKYWHAFRAFVLRWFGLAVALMLLGLLLKQQLDYPFGGRVVAVIGAILLQLLFVFLMFISVPIARILVFKFNVIKQVTKKITFQGGSGSNELTTSEKDVLKASQDRLRSHLMAALVLMSASLLLVEIFVSWKALGLTVILVSLVLKIALAKLQQGKAPGPSIQMIEIICFVLLIMTLLTFLAVELMPQSFGTLSFNKVDGWFASGNKSEWIIGLIAFGLLLLLLKGAFTKDLARKQSYLQAFKWLLLISIVLVPFLMWKGTMDFKEVTGHEPPDLGEKIDGIKEAFRSNDTKKVVYERPVGSGVAPSSTYFPPPKAYTPTTTPTTVRRPVVQTRPLPPKPEAKTYENDPGAALDDLERLGYR